MADKLDISEVFNSKLIKKGLLIFLLITTIVLITIFFYSDGQKTLEVWSEIQIEYLSVALMFIIVDLYIGGLRNHIFMRQFVPSIKQWVSVKANLANMFMGAVTPFQAGGGPAQWYIYYRNGASLPDNVGVSFYNWISTLIFFPISGLFALYHLRGTIPEGFVTNLTQLGFSVFTTILLTILAGLFTPQLLNRLIKIIAQLLSVIRSSWRMKLVRVGDSIIAKLTDYRQKYVGLMLGKPQLMLFSFVLTIILYFNKYALAYLLVLAFGINTDFWTVVAVMATSYLLSYFAPSPGGSGIAEVSIAAMLTPIVGAHVAPSITLLHRSFMLFAPTLLGALVVLRQISLEKNDKTTGLSG